VPAVDWRRTAKRVLTTEWIDGIPIGEKAALAAAGHDVHALGMTVIRSFLMHAMRDGFFHADMHQGNLFVDKAGTVVAVDFGIMGRLGPREQRFLAEILHGLITRDYRRAAEVHFWAGYVPPHHPVEVFAQALRAIGEPIHGKTASEISMADLLGQLFAYTDVFDMQTRPELILLQKSMVIVEGVARSLNPSLNMWVAAEPIAKDWVESNLSVMGRLKDAGDSAAILAQLAADLPVFADPRVRRVGGGEQRSDSVLAALAALLALGDPSDWVLVHDAARPCLQPGDLVIIAGRPSMGKTSLALNIGEHVALDTKMPVAVFSMEMGASQLALRMIGSVGRLDQHKLRTGRLAAEDWEKLSVALGRLSEAPILIDDTPALNAIEVRSRARRLAKTYGKLGLVIVDYLQLMQATTTSRDANRVQEVSEISRGLKALARELSVPVIALSQLSRQPEMRESKEPRLSDLRESGAIEQDADLMIFGWGGKSGPHREGHAGPTISPTIDEVVRESQQEVVRGHDAAGEEAAPHPGALEGVGVPHVREHVHEQAAVVAQQAPQQRQQRAPVAHVLEHLDRNDSVVAAGRLESVHVSRDHGDVREAASTRLRLDPRSLRGGVRHGSDAAAPVIRRHPQGERAPAAAEFENVLAVNEAGVLAGRREAAGLRVCERVRSLGPPGAGVLEVRSQGEFEEACRNLVVLLVREVRHGREIRRVHGRDEGFGRCCGALAVASRDLAQALFAETTDAGAHHGVRHESLLDPVDRKSRGLAHVFRSCV